MKIIQQKLDALTSRRTRTDQLMEEEPKEAPQTYATTPKKNKEQIQKKAPQPTMEHSAVEEKEGGNSPDSQQKHSMIMVPILLSIPKTFWATMRGQFLVEIIRIATTRANGGVHRPIHGTASKNQQSQSNTANNVVYGRSGTIRIVAH